MIRQNHKSTKKRLDKTTITTFRMLARKGTDLQLEQFLFDAMQLYTADLNDASLVDADRCLVIGDEQYVCKCPYCNKEMELLLKELLKNN